MRGVAKSNLPQKDCIQCGRPFAWRKKWERDWDQVSVRYGIYAQRSLGIWTPELSSEWWFEQFSPFSSLRRTRLSAGINLKQGKHLRWSAMVALQRDYLGLDILEADFAIVRLGLRYKL